MALASERWRAGSDRDLKSQAQSETTTRRRIASRRVVEVRVTADRGATLGAVRVERLDPDQIFVRAAGHRVGVLDRAGPTTARRQLDLRCVRIVRVERTLTIVDVEDVGEQRQRHALAELPRVVE